MGIVPRAGWIPYSPRLVSSVAVSHGINANLIRKCMNGGPDIIIAAGPMLKAPDGNLPTQRIVLSYSWKTCENSHSGIESSRRRSIGDATLAGRNRKAHQRPVFIAGAFLCPRRRVMAVVRGTPSGVPGSFRPGRPTRVLLPPQLAWPRAVAVPSRKELMHDHRKSAKDPRIRSPPSYLGGLRRSHLQSISLCLCNKGGTS